MQFTLLGLMVFGAGASTAFASTTSNQIETPRLFSQANVDSAAIAEAVNYYVSIGETKAIEELQTLDSDEYGIGYRSHVRERIGWMCRILFIPKEGGSLRPPALGGLLLPQQSMPAKNWPMFPVANSGETYFVLAQGYNLAGTPESASRYLEYCRTNGTFRTEKIPVPARETAINDISKMRNSRQWTEIKWKDSGPGWSYDVSEQRIWKSIIAQAESIAN